MAESEDLALEQAVIDRIGAVRATQLDRVAERASRLAAEVATMTEDGLRDIFDEDDDPDAAVQASFVRERSMHAMAAARRFHEVDAVGARAAFGRVTADDGERLYVGRCSVIQGDEVLLVDWRAPAAMPFYRATPLDRLSITHRRHLHYGGAADDEPQLTGYSDEVLDAEHLLDFEGLQGEAALLASLERERTGQMASVVATIQAEQDGVIRARSDRPLLVQGGPGTGKTVVALHRAAYLLYDQRQALAENGVLIVGPTTQFLAYISEVLPSLGETGVVSAIPAELYPGVLRGRVETDEVTSLKGSMAMVTLLRNGVSDRQRLPKQDLVAWYGSDRVRLDTEALRVMFIDAQRSPTHNEGAERFRVLLIEALAEKVYSRSFDNYADAYRSFASSRDLRVFLLRHWPTLTAEQALNDLFGSPALLRLAARGCALSRDDVASLGRERVSESDLADARWSDADVPLLDELWSIVGGIAGSTAKDQRQRARDVRDEFEIAAVQDAMAGAGRDANEAGELDVQEQDGFRIMSLEEAEGLPAPPLRAWRV